jgi:hypothetical protein
LIDEVTDEVIGNVTKMLRGEYGIRELVQDPWVNVLDRLDPPASTDS